MGGEVVFHTGGGGVEDFFDIVGDGFGPTIGFDLFEVEHVLDHPFGEMVGAHASCELFGSEVDITDLTTKDLAEDTGDVVFAECFRACEDVGLAPVGGRLQEGCASDPGDIKGANIGDLAVASGSIEGVIALDTSTCVVEHVVLEKGGGKDRPCDTAVFEQGIACAVIAARPDTVGIGSDDGKTDDVLDAVAFGRLKGELGVGDRIFDKRGEQKQGVRAFHGAIEGGGLLVIKGNDFGSACCDVGGFCGVSDANAQVCVRVKELVKDLASDGSCCTCQ